MKRLLARRRRLLENFFKRISGSGAVKLSPAAADRQQAQAGMHQRGKFGLVANPG